MGTGAARRTLLTTILLLGVGSPTSASTVFLESITDAAIFDEDVLWELTRYDDDDVGLVGIRFTLDAPLHVTGAEATLHRSPSPSYTSNRFFAGFEPLASPTTFPSFAPVDGPSALAGYVEAEASTELESHVLFPMGLLLDPGSYALIVGCVSDPCEGLLPFATGFNDALIPEDDFLASSGTPTSQFWGPRASGAFRLAVLTVPEPGSEAIVALGVIAVLLTGTKRSRR